MDAVVRHPGDAKVTTTHPGVRRDRPTTSSGSPTASIVRTYASAHGLGTQRPVRNRPRGLEDPDFPGPSRVYEPVTALPMETLPDTFVHPAGYCQNVLATGRCLVTGTRPRRRPRGRSCSSATTRARPRWPATGRTSTSRSPSTARPASSCAWSSRSAAPSPAHAEVVELAPDAPLPPSAFDFVFPTGTTMLY